MIFVYFNLKSCFYSATQVNWKWKKNHLTWIFWIDLFLFCVYFDYLIQYFKWRNYTWYLLPLISKIITISYILFPSISLLFLPHSKVWCRHCFLLDKWSVQMWIRTMQTSRGQTWVLKWVLEVVTSLNSNSVSLESSIIFSLCFPYPTS